MTAGIYKITNKYNLHFYFGSSCNIERREKVHFQLLERNDHENPHLQAAYNKYGPDCFRFVLIEIIRDNENIMTELCLKEQEYLDLFVGQPCCYNISKNTFAPMRGRKHSKETKEKMKAAKKDKYNGINNPMYGKKRPDTAIRNKKACGSLAPCYGRTGKKHPMWKHGKSRKKVLDVSSIDDRITI